MRERYLLLLFPKLLLNWPPDRLNQRKTKYSYEKQGSQNRRRGDSPRRRRIVARQILHLPSNTFFQRMAFTPILELFYSSWGLKSHSIVVRLSFIWEFPICIKISGCHNTVGTWVVTSDIFGAAVRRRRFTKKWNNNGLKNGEAKLRRSKKTTKKL